ncbi:DUF317 domain-containing protein [Yinghuangia aomiensis]
MVITAALLRELSALEWTDDSVERLRVAFDTMHNTFFDATVAERETALGLDEDDAFGDAFEVAWFCLETAGDDPDRWESMQLALGRMAARLDEAFPATAEVPVWVAHSDDAAKVFAMLAISGWVVTSADGRYEATHPEGYADDRLWRVSARTVPNSHPAWEARFGAFVPDAVFNAFYEAVAGPPLIRSDQDPRE